MDPLSPVRQPFKLVLSLSFWLIPCSLALAQDSPDSAAAESADFGVQLTKRLEGHTGPIYSIVYSPDHKRMVSAGGIFNAPGEFIIWDASAGAEKMRFNGHQGPVYGLTYAPDGTHFASAGSDGMIRVWDAETGTEIRSLDGHSGEAYCVLFSRDGSLLISGGGTQDQPGEVIIRNASTWEELRRLNGHVGSVLSLAISTDGKLLATGGLDEIIRVWNLQTGETVKEIPGHSGRISSIAFGPAQDELLSSSSDRTLRRWNVQTGEQIDVWVNNDRSQPSMELHHTAVNRHGDLIATAASNKFVYLWDHKGTKLASLPGHTLASKCVAFSPNGEQLASAGADRTILLWELPKAAPLPLFGRSSNPHTPVTLRTAANWVVASDICPDGRLVATGDNTNAVVVVDVITQKVVFQLKGHTGWVTDVSFSPDGRWLASSSYDQSVIIWDMQTGKEEFRWSTLTTVMTCDFSPDSMWIACNSGTGPEGREISVWEALTGTKRFTLAKHGSTVMDLTFSSDGTKLASASNDGTVILWDMINGVDLATFRGLKDGRTNNLWSTAFSPDGKVLAAAGRHEQIYLWNTETQEPIQTIDVARGGIHDLVFTPDGKWLISSSGEFQSHGEIMVWDPVSGDSILAIPAHTDRTKSIALSPRGDWLISTSDDKTVKLWNIGAAISEASQKTADNTEP